MRGRHHRRVPGGEPRADGHAAAAAARVLLRPRGGGRAHPPRARSRAARCTRTCGGATARSRSPTRTRCSSSAWRRPSACRCSRSSSCRWRSTSPASPRGSPTGCARRWARSGRGRAWRAMRDRLLVGMAERGITGEIAEEIVHKLEALRRLRVPREPLGELRLPRVRELVDQAALPGRVRVRAAQRAADGLLLAAHHRARRDPSRRGGARPVRRARRAATARSSRAPRPPDPIGRAAARAGTPTRRSTRCASGSGTCAGFERRAARPHRRRARRAAVHRPRGLHPPHRRAHRRARGARHRGRVRVLRARPARARCGPRARCATPGPTSCRAWSPGSRRRRCRG